MIQYHAFSIGNDIFSTLSKLSKHGAEAPELDMSQQAAAGQASRRGGGRKPIYYPRVGGSTRVKGARLQAYESPIMEIRWYTFNMGEN